MCPDSTGAKARRGWEAPAPEFLNAGGLQLSAILTRRHSLSTASIPSQDFTSSRLRTLHLTERQIKLSTRTEFVWLSPTR
jgi:hypothetical protein